MKDFYHTIETTDRPYNVMGLCPPNKLAAIAQFAGLDAASKVIEFGCGFGETLLVWAETFGISGIGLDAGEDQIRVANDAAQRSPHASRLKYICTDAPKYEFEIQSFNMAACIKVGFLSRARCCRSSKVKVGSDSSAAGGSSRC